MQETTVVHRGLLLCLVLAALLAAVQHARIEAQAARIGMLEAQADAPG